MSQVGQEKNIFIKFKCIEQLTKLCTMNYDHLVYPYICNELVDIKELNSSESYRLERLYLKVNCILKMISHRYF
jgi:hypothetical protein